MIGKWNLWAFFSRKLNSVRVNPLGEDDMEAWIMAKSGRKKIMKSLYGATEEFLFPTYLGFNDALLGNVSCVFWRRLDYFILHCQKVQTLYDFHFLLLWHGMGSSLICERTL